MSHNPLQEIMNARSIAFFGASSSMAKMGTGQLVTLLCNHYPGAIYPIHPREEEIFGLRAYRRVGDIGKPVDLAVIILPAKLVPGIVRELGEAGIRRAVIVTAGFSEAGGGDLQRELDDASKSAGLRYVGPNCIGVANLHQSYNFTIFPFEGKPGTLGMLSHSGTFVTHLMPYLNARRLNWAEAISLGNEGDLDIVDGLDYMAGREPIKAITCYIETIRRGRDFMEKAAAVSRVKPVIALYASGTEASARATASHTAAIATPEGVINGMFSQTGIVRADSLEEMFDFACVLSRCSLPKGRRVGILTNSGGPGAIMAGTVARCGMSLPRFSPALQQAIAAYAPPTASLSNPVDFTFINDWEGYFSKVPRLIAESGEVDVLLYYGFFGVETFLHYSDHPSVAPSLDRAIIDAAMKIGDSLKHTIADTLKGLPVPIICSTFLDLDESLIAHLIEHDVPFLPTPERAARAAWALCRYAEWRRNRISD
ncbi:MAG: CoA-binding protein [Spirochaetes bacterium]|nr:MAG: CoA-binding protein [Spirochaetota bacterium]